MYGILAGIVGVAVTLSILTELVHAQKQQSRPDSHQPPDIKRLADAPPTQHHAPTWQKRAADVLKKAKK